MKEPCRLYLISPPALDARRFVDPLKHALGAGDVACFQLRLKGDPDAQVLRTAEVLMPVCVEYGVAFIINDRADLAKQADADGVHIGAEDGDYEAARALIGKDRIVGISCYDSRHRAMEAAEAGADYVAFGAFFPTATKEPRARAEIDVLEWWNEIMVVPCVAIGGITPENCGPLVAAGADFLAVISAVWEHKDGPEVAVLSFNEAIARAKD
ncbi:MAG: thiamine phosphate synthase [Alphaproteobacteria bacterium]|nr:thiamine phosphate synthase [Alphaproteobacteria bacterium]